MAKETKKPVVAKNLYKVANIKNFKAWYSDSCKHYEELSSGEAVEVDLKNKNVIDWINNKIIVKE